MSAVLLFSTEAFAQLDRSKAPAPGPAPKVEIGKYEKFTMKNGLRVIVVNDDKRPLVSATLSFVHDPIMQGDKAGLLEVYGDLLRRGTENRTVDQISNEIDFIGARFSTSARTVAFTTLTKYADRMMDMMSDVVLNPTFPKEEFDKLMVQYETGLESEKTDPSSIISNMQSKVIYGEGHPYGSVTTKESLASLSTEDFEAFHDTYFRPNNAILVFVGDITVKEAKQLTSKYFKKWKKASIPQTDAPAVVSPEGINVVFSAKDASVQSSIQLVYPLDYRIGDKENLAIQMANYIYGGGGFSAKLMKNLREDKGYTYGAYSSVSSDILENAGSFVAAAEVNANATDSSFIEMTKELNSMLAGEFTDKDLQTAKAAYAGSFSRSLENSATVADFAYSIERFGLPEDYYETYLQRLDAVTREDVIKAAKRIFHPDNAYYFVVGDPSVLEGLRKLDSDGQILELDYKGDKVERKAVSEDVTVESVMDRYLEFVGGKDKVNSVAEFSCVTEMNAGGAVVVNELSSSLGAQVSMKMVTKMGDVLVNTGIYENGVFRMEGLNGKQEISDPSVAVQAYPYREALVGQYGLEAKLAGIENIDGKDAYKVQFSVGGQVYYGYYDIETGAKVRETMVVDPASGTSQIVKFADYQATDCGLLYPMSQNTEIMGTVMAQKVISVAMQLNK